jgi:hypothetical protein
MDVTPAKGSFSVCLRILRTRYPVEPSLVAHTIGVPARTAIRVQSTYSCSGQKDISHLFDVPVHDIPQVCVFDSERKPDTTSLVEWRLVSHANDGLDGIARPTCASN